MNRPTRGILLSRVAHWREKMCSGWQHKPMITCVVCSACSSKTCGNRCFHALQHLFVQQVEQQHGARFTVRLSEDGL